MTNNTIKGTKKSAFLAKTDIPAGTTFDYVSNGVNYKIDKDDLITGLGATGTIVQAGPASGASAVLDVSGTINRIRSITPGFGISASVNASNGLTIATAFTFNTAGAQLVTSTSASAPVFKSLIGGSGLDSVETPTTITFSVTSGQTVIVTTLADFPTASSGVITLAANTNYKLVANISTGNRFIFSDKSSLQADNETNTSLTYTGTGNMFSWINANVHIEHITIKFPNGTALSGLNTTASTFIFDCAGVDFDGKTLGAIGKTKQIRFTRCDFELSTNGFTFSGDLGFVLFVSGFADLAAGTLFNLGTSTSDGITFDKMITRGASSAKFLDGAANSANINAGGVGVLNNCHVDGPSLLGSNINVNNARFEFRGNDEVANTRPDGLLTLIGNSTATTIAGAGTAVLVAGSWQVDAVSQSVGTTAGRYQYKGSKNAKLPILVDLTVTPVSGAAIAMSAYIAVNGSIVARSRRAAPLASGGLIQVITVPWQIDAETDDYIEVFVANDSSTVNLLVSSAVLRIN